MNFRPESQKLRGPPIIFHDDPISNSLNVDTGRTTFYFFRKNLMVTLYFVSSYSTICLYLGSQNPKDIFQVEKRLKHRNDVNNFPDIYLLLKNDKDHYKNPKCKNLKKKLVIITY